MFYRNSLTVGFHVDEILVTGKLDEQENAFWELSRGTETAKETSVRHMPDSG